MYFSLKNIKIASLIIAFIGLLSFSFYEYRKNKALEFENSNLINTNLAYEGIINKNASKNYVMKLSADDVKNTSDSLTKEAIKNIKDVDESSNIIIDVTKTSGEASDSISNAVNDKCEFVKEVKINNQTSVIVDKSKDSIKCTVSITDTLVVNTYNDRQYKHKYKNFFRRLIKFDFKKIDVIKYEISHSNKLIKDIDSRNINIVK